MNENIKNIVIVILLIGCGALLYLQFGSQGKGGGGSLSGKEAVEAALAFINTEMITNGGAALLGGDITEENGLYKFDMAIDEQSFPIYVTKNGLMLFYQGAVEIKEAAKTEAALLEAFVVSYCPYGLQMQRILAEIDLQAPQLSQNIVIRYIGETADGQVQSMHGEQEAQENLRQICLREEQADRFMPYLSCFMKAGESQACLTETGVDQRELETCMAEPDRGLAYAQTDFDKQNEYGVSGSPSLILNGVQSSEFKFGGRTAEAVKQLLCSGFEEEPEACSLELSAEEAAAAFSEFYAGEGSSGSCE